MAAHCRNARAVSPSGLASNSVLGPKPVMASAMLPEWSKTGTDNASMPGKGLPSACARPACARYPGGPQRRRGRVKRVAGCYHSGIACFALNVVLGNLGRQPGGKYMTRCGVQHGHHRRHLRIYDVHRVTGLGNVDHGGPCDPSTVANVWPIWPASWLTWGTATRTVSRRCRLTSPICKANGPSS